MKRKVGYIIALLVILAGVIAPAVCMHKFTSPIQQHKQAESVNANAQEQGNAADQSRSTAGQDQPSSGAVQGQPDPKVKQGSTLPDQQAFPANNNLTVSTAPVQTADNVTTVPVQTVDNAETVTEPEGSCRVGIAIVGKNGEHLFGPAQVMIKKENKWGITALGALEATGISYTTYPTWPDFVNSISGQACSGVAGWMYAVNGDSPMHMADKHPVKEGDKVIWWYSKSMDQPQPQWEDLVQKK